MDPNETLKQLLNAIDHNDHMMTDQNAVDLIDWLRCGGFVPKMSDDVARRVLMEFCRNS